MTWGQRARCKNKATAKHDPWFPEDEDGNEDYSEEKTWIARAECAACPVREMCLEYAIETGQQHGIWAGYSPEERRHIVLTRALEEG